MIYPTKQDFIAHLRTLQMEVAVVITNDHGELVGGIISHRLPGIALHTIQFTYPKAFPEGATFNGPEWHWPAGIIPDVRDGVRRLNRDEVIFLVVDHTPVREYGISLAFPED